MLDIADECISTMSSKISRSWGANKKPTRLFLFSFVGSKISYVYILHIQCVCMYVYVYIYTHTPLCQSD